MRIIGVGGVGAVAIAGALALASCAMKPSTLPKVTVGNTGCSPEELAVFGYNSDARSWMAICGTQLFSCSDAGRRTARCNHLATAAQSPELERRAQLLLKVPLDHRGVFITKNIAGGTDEDYAWKLAMIAALDSESLAAIGDVSKLCPLQDPRVQQALRRCDKPRLLYVKVDKETGKVDTDPFYFEHVANSQCFEKALQGWKVPAGYRGNSTHVYIFSGKPDPAVLAAAKQALKPPAAEAKAQPTSEAGAATTPPSPDGAPSADPAIDASIRTQLDAHRDDVLACVNAPRAVVRVDYTAEGELTVALQGKLAGTPVEGCVKAALGDLHVDGATAPGVVVHLIH